MATDATGMERTVAIDETLLDAARDAAGTTDDREVVEMGLRELLRRQQVRALVESFGTFELTMTEEELQRLRRGEIARLQLDE